MNTHGNSPNPDAMPVKVNDTVCQSLCERHERGMRRDFPGNDLFTPVAYEWRPIAEVPDKSSCCCVNRTRQWFAEGETAECRTGPRSEEAIDNRHVF